MYVFLKIPDLLVISHASSSYSPSTTLENMCALKEYRGKYEDYLDLNKDVISIYPR